MQQFSDTEIVTSVQAGNAVDYSLLVSRYRDKSFSMLRKMLRNDSAAADALQDSFIKAFRLILSFRKESSFSTWLYKIVYTTGLNYLKKDKLQLQRFTDLEEGYDVSIPMDRPDITIEGNEKQLMVQRMINSLPPKTATAITLFYLNECSINEIAGIMQISEANVKVILHRGRAALKEYIEVQQLQKELL